MPRRVRRIGLGAAALLTLSALVGQAALAAPPTDGPPGNNGTVKIHEGPGEPPPVVRNEPHVCTFHLHFFFADPEQAGTWEIQEWSPGDKGVVVLNGTYDTVGDGEDRDPEQSAFELPDGHYKLFWDGDLDTNKHDKMKVFWVDCEVGPTVVTHSAPPSQVDSPNRSIPPMGGIEALPGGQDLAAGGEVGGTSVTPPPTDTAAVQSASTDTNWPLAFLVIATIIAASSLLTPVKRPDRRTR